MGGATAIIYVKLRSAVTAPSMADDTIGIDDEVLLKMNEAIPNFAEVTENAHAANDFEHQMTLSQGHWFLHDLISRHHHGRL